MTRRFPPQPEPHPDPILPDNPDLEELHTRTYEVRAFKVSPTEFIVRGAVRDHKPAGLYVVDDPEVLTIHHMVLELRIAYPSFEILEVNTSFHEFPSADCPSIVPKYQLLVGQSVMRGFNKFVRDNFGGPRGCTHTTALLTAMGPVATQVGWSMRVSNSGGFRSEIPADADPETVRRMREAGLASNLNTCHVWHEDGAHVARVREGTMFELPLSVKRRHQKLGRAVD